MSCNISILLQLLFSPAQALKLSTSLRSVFSAKFRRHTAVGNKKNFSLEKLVRIKYWPQVGRISRRSKQNWVPERYLCHIYINTHAYIYKSTYYMFASWIMNFQVTFRKIISLEPHMKLERLVNEVFFYQNMHFFHVKIVRRRRRRRRR
jgi:hypothetical protein